jgi:hypothetical protein
MGVDGQATLRTANMLTVLEKAPGEFDAISASDLVWPGNFDDPADTVQPMTTALAPGGIRALLYSNSSLAGFSVTRRRCLASRPYRGLNTHAARKTTVRTSTIVPPTGRSHDQDT